MTATTTIAGPRLSISLPIAIAHIRIDLKRSSDRGLLNPTETGSSFSKEAKIRQRRRPQRTKHVSMRPVRQLSLILVALLVCTVMVVVRSIDREAAKR